MHLLDFFFQLPVALEFSRVTDYSNAVPHHSILNFKSNFLEIIEREGQTYVFFVTYRSVEEKYELNCVKVIIDHTKAFDFAAEDFELPYFNMGSSSKLVSD